MIVSELLMLQQGLIGGFIDNYVPIGNNHFANAVSSPLAFAYAILAVIAMSYPLSGFLAEVCCGRFKIHMIGLGFLLFPFVIVITLLVWASSHFSNWCISFCMPRTRHLKIISCTVPPLNLPIFFYSCLL